ncbi:hypothetical protein HPB49_022497 [Dermacentor silvarum]|uniref:Uncharacterized protein n=1 Tax=Dermacentor silvarum TaxID=543639 RepID=A0ACB8CN41_DERSI|nr:hypothetical protein HPB49_022497 [Dermacentor silvarum]
MPSKPDSEGWTLVNPLKNAPFNKPTTTTSFTSRLHGHKVILRPQGGFVLTTLRPAQLMSAVSAAACLTDNEYKETQVEIQEHKNLAVFVSTRNSVAQKLAQLTTLTIQATSHQVSIYLAPPDNSCRGVVHEIEARTTSAELMANLEAPGQSTGVSHTIPVRNNAQSALSSATGLTFARRHSIFAAPSALSLCRSATPLTHVPRTAPTATALTLLQIQPVRVYRQQTKLLIKLPDSGMHHAHHHHHHRFHQTWPLPDPTLRSAIRQAAPGAGLLAHLADDPNPELRKATSRAASRDLDLPVPTLRELRIRGSCRRPQCLRLV